MTTPHPSGMPSMTCPCFDAMFPFTKQPAWGPYPSRASSNYGRNGVRDWRLVSSTPDEGTIMLWEFAPHRHRPGVAALSRDAGSSNWDQGRTALADYLRGQARKVPAFQGIGGIPTSIIFDTADETLFPFRSSPWPRARNITLPRPSPAQTDPLASMASIRRQTIDLWAHAGLGERNSSSTS